MTGTRFSSHLYLLVQIRLIKIVIFNPYFCYFLQFYHSLCEPLLLRFMLNVKEFEVFQCCSPLSLYKKESEGGPCSYIGIGSRTLISTLFENKFREQ